MKREYKIVKKDRSGLDPVLTPTCRDIAWAAGVFEGEGSCVASGTNRTSFTADVSQKDPELLYRLRDLFGGSVKLYNVGNERRFLCHMWRICGDKARVFIGAVYPYLTARRKAQIESTPAWKFLSMVPELLVPDQDGAVESKQCAALKIAVEKINVECRSQAKAHRKAYFQEWEKKRSADPAKVARRKEVRAKRRSLLKQALTTDTKVKVIEMERTA